MSRQIINFDTHQNVCGFFINFAPADDIRGSEILIKEEEGRWFCSTHYGAFIPIEDMEDEDDEPEDIYQWLSEFEC